MNADETLSNYGLYQQQNEVQNLIWRLDPTPIIDEIEHHLRGEFYDSETNKYYSQKQIGDRVILSQAILNDIGIHAITTRLKSILNKNNVLGNMTRDSINKICEEVSHELIDMIEVNFDVWEIDESYWDYVVNFVVHQIEIFMSRTLDDGERKSISNQYRYVENKISQRTEDNNKVRFFK